MEHATHVRRDTYGDISHVQLESGTVLNYLEAFDLAKEGQIDNVVDTEDFFGRPTVEFKSLETNEAVSLPKF